MVGYSIEKSTKQKNIISTTLFINWIVNFVLFKRKNIMLDGNKDAPKREVKKPKKDKVPLKK